MRSEDAARCLGHVPVDELVAWLEALDPQRWQDDRHRQERFEVHRMTRTLRAIWTEPSGFPTASTEVFPLWGEIEGWMSPILAGIRRGLGHPFAVANVMLARLDPGGHISMHHDSGPFFAACHRVHVALSTEAAVCFVVDGERIVMGVGEAWEIDNTRLHGVTHTGQRPRVHLILDLAPLPSR